jgi:hypothetical protein
MHESLIFFIFYLKKKNKGILEILTGFNENPNGWVKLKDRYTKLTLFKV